MSAYAENEAGVKHSGKKMTDGELKSMLDAQKMSALASVWSSKLSSERDDALMYYMNDMSKDMPSMDGRSNAVSSDVADTIEGLMPAMMEIFAGSEEVVRFNPVGPEDVAAAEQETDYINHVFMHENPGFVVLYSFIKDALLSKVGVVKIWWEDREEIEEETYKDLTDDELDIILSDKGVKVVEHSEHPIDDPHLQLALSLSPPHSAVQDIMDKQRDDDKPAPNVPSAPAGGQAPQGAPQGPQQGMGQGGAPVMAPQGPASAGAPPQLSRSLHDVKVRKTNKVGQTKILGVPPEEFGIEKTARSLRLHECNYCFHRSIISQNRLLEMGFDEDVVDALPTYTAITMPEEINRDSVDEHQNVGTEHNPAARRVEVIEHYVRMDYTGNGRAELYKVYSGASEGQLLYRDGGKLALEKIDDFPFAAMTPIIMTHRFFGRSIHDVVSEIQRIKTALLRAALDNAYLANNPRVEVAESHSSDNTLDDLLISRPGGLVRVKQPGGITWQPVPTIGQHVFPLLEYQDSRLERRTGVTEQGQGLNPEALQNQTATSANAMISMAQSRMKLIARVFAETGIRDLFILVHAMERKHGGQAKTVRLKNKWVKIDPRDWKKRNDMVVEVGIGSGGKQEKMQMLQLIGGLQNQALVAGLTNLVSPHNLYEMARAVTQVAGFKNTDRFFTDPKGQPPPPPKQDPKVQIEQMKAQTQMQLTQKKMQLDSQHEQAKFQADAALEQQKFQHERQMAMMEMGMKQQEHKLSLHQMQQEHELKKADMAQNMLMQQHKAQVENDAVQQKTNMQMAQAEHDRDMAKQTHQQEMDMSNKKFEHETAMGKQKLEVEKAKGASVKKVLRDKQGRMSGVEG